MADTWYIDYSAGALDGPTIVNTTVGPQGEKATGALRYIDDITNPALVRRKHVTRAEYQSLQAAGVAMPAFFMEVSTNDPVGGYAQGQAYARRALAGLNYLGSDAKIIMCCDGWMNSVGVTKAQWQAYLNGAKSVAGDRIGGYGFSDAADAAQGIVSAFVQCGARSAVRGWVTAWQDNNVQPYVGGKQADRLLIFKPFSQEEDMANSDEILRVVNMINNDLGKVWDATGHTAGDLLVRLAWLFPYTVDTKAILARGGHSAGDLVNAGHSAWEGLFFTVMPQLKEQGAKIDLLNTAVAALASNKDLTPEALQQMLNEAASKISISVNVQPTPATPQPPAQPAPQSTQTPEAQK